MHSLPMANRNSVIACTKLFPIENLSKIQNIQLHIQNVKSKRCTIDLTVSVNGW